MADLKISELGSLAGADLVAADVVAVVDNSASETKKLTVSDLIANGVTLISDATIPSAKVLFSAGSVNAAALASSAVETAKINDSAVTAGKLADNSSVTLVSTLPGSGDFVGQVALDTDDSKIYVWSGSAWTSVKAAGSINVVSGSTSGLVNITATTSGDTVTISTTLTDTSAARQFLAGPTGSGGTVGYRAIIGTDLPTASSSEKGGVIVNGNGLAMSGDTLTVNNSVTAETTENHLVKYDANGLVTSGRVIASGDVPVATSSTTGGVQPGTGLSVTGSGVLNHSNSLTAATGPKITFDAQGHVTGSTALVATDIPDLDAAKLTTGSLPSARIADDAITADKLADRSTATIAEITPAGGAFIGQTHLNSITGDYFLWDGNVWQPIGISVGEIVLAGTYNATTNLVATVTTEGTAVGYTVGQALPAASSSNKGHYVIISTAGTGTSPAPTVALSPPDFLLSTGTLYTEIDVSQTVTAQQASNVQFTPTGSIAANNVQTAIAEVDTEKAPKASPTFSGTVSLDTAATIQFEGSSANDFETTLTVTDPTADRTITLPNVTGTVVTTGDTGSVTSAMIADGAIVNADINAGAEIAVNKLANGTARQLLQTDAGGSGVEFTSNVDVPGTLDVTSAATFDSTVAVTGLLSANGKLAYPAGSASAVSLYAGSDTDTGIYSPGANQFGIATAGTSRIVVDANGNTGIGTTSPGSYQSVANDLVVGNHSGAHGITIASENNNSGYLNFADGTSSTNQQANGRIFYSHANLSMRFDVDASERMRIDSSGRLLLGTSSSYGSTNSDALTIGDRTQSEVGITLGSTVASAIRFADAGNVSAGIIQYVHNAGGTDYMNFYTNSTERLRIDSSGKVGIGTTAPTDNGSDTMLAVRRNASGQSASIAIQSASNAASLIRFADGTSTAAERNSGSLRVDHSNGSMEFSLQNSEKMRIDSSGRLLIGTTSAQTIGNSQAQLQLSTDSSSGYALSLNRSVNDIFAPQINFRSTRGTAGSPIPVNNNDQLGSIAFYGYDGTDSNHQHASIAAFVDGAPGSNDCPGRLVFSTTADGASSPTERVRIDSSGQVGIGTSSPRAKLDVSGNLFLAAGNQIQISGNAGSSGLQLIGNDSSASLVGTMSAQPLTFRTNSAERMRIDSSGNVGIGDTNPPHKLCVNGNVQINTGNNLRSNSSGGTLQIQGGSTFPGGNILLGGGSGTNDIRFRTTGSSSTSTERMRIDSNGRILIGPGAVATPKCGYAGIDVPNFDYSIVMGGSDGNGNRANSANKDGRFCGAHYTNAEEPIGIIRCSAGSSANEIAMGGGSSLINAATLLAFYTASNNTTTGGSERMRIDSSGRLLVGTTSAAYSSALKLQGSSGDTECIVRLCRDNDSPNDQQFLSNLLFSDSSELPSANIITRRDGGTWSSSSKPGALCFGTTADGGTSPTERMRIDRHGLVDIGGHGNGGLSVTTPVGVPLQLNRTGSDGGIVRFKQDGTDEGSITVSGSTVSYNGAHLSRWSQLASGADRTEIFRGSVLSNLDEMCEWGEEDNEQLNRMQVSTVEGDKNVSGVFQAWDDDDDTYVNDFYCAMTGDFVIRIAQGTTVARGDLLMSAGDGTAKPQDDDIVRSKTVAKVTSTTVSETYADGSYCVPCVLMAC